jgi:hypothetical protein
MARVRPEVQAFLTDGPLPDPDDCYGAAWTLLRLIETGPNPVFTVRPEPGANEWQHRLWQRCVNAGLVADEPAA